MSRFSSFVLCLIAAPGLLAQTPPPTGGTVEEDLLALLNTPVQGASKREQRLIDSPQAIEVLTGDEIRSTGIYRLVDALKLLTSVDVLDLGNQVTYVTLRGAMQQGQPKTVQILVDGVPLYNPVAASVDLDNFPVPVDLIDKVEVVRGPSSSIYGANAVVGVIAITTRRALNGLHGGARASRADLGSSRGSADLAFGGRGYGVVAGYQGAALGVSDRTTTNLSNNQPGLLDRDNSHQWHGFARIDCQLGPGSSVWLGSGSAYKEVGTFTNGNFPYQAFLTQTVNGGWSHAWAEGIRTELRWGHLIQKFSLGPSAALAAAFNDPNLGHEYAWIDLSSDLLELQMNWDVTKSVHLVGGLDRRVYRSDRSTIIGFPVDYDEGASGGFLNLDWNTLPNLTFSLGARVENETLGGSRTSPRAAVVWNPSKASSLRVGYYSATRSPQIGESRVDFTNSFTPPSPPLPPGSLGVFRIIPNPGLEPEKVTSLEVGYRHVLEAFSFDITAFRMTFDQLIAQYQVMQEVVPGAPFRLIVTNQYLNTAGAENTGIEAAVTWRPFKEVTAGCNATWLDYKNESFVAPGGAIIPETVPSYVPTFKANAWVKVVSGRLSAHLSFQHIGKVKMELLSVNGTATAPVDRDAINQANLNLAWEFLPGASVAAYSRYALKDFTDQGAGGPTRISLVQPSRRETGLTLRYRF